jgi:hypothetical protein
LDLMLFAANAFQDASLGRDCDEEIDG